MVPFDLPPPIVIVHEVGRLNFSPPDRGALTPRDRDRRTNFTTNETGTLFGGAIPLAIAPTAAFSSDALRNVTSVAAARWSAVSGVRFLATNTSGADDDSDGLSSIVVHTTSWPSRFTAAALAQTVLRVGDDGKTREGDVHINAFDYRFNIAPDGTPLAGDDGSTIDLRGILTHELGHVLGLGHSNDGRATMYAAYPISTPLSWRSLEADDRLGAQSLYPTAGDGGCSIHACPSGFLCVANRCEELHARATSCAPCRADGASCDGAGDDARCLTYAGAAAETGVCGRACDGEGSAGTCGDEARCLASSGAGDFRCSSDCTRGPAACKQDADCSYYPATTCVAGVCLYAAPAETADAGLQSEAGIPENSGKKTDSSDGCMMHALPGRGAFASTLGAFVTLAGLLRRRRATRR